MTPKNTPVADLREAILEAQAELMEIVREVMVESIVPQVQLEARRKWARMSDEQREQFKAERPDQYAALMQG